jgi:hypothetical protein
VREVVRKEGGPKEKVNRFVALASLWNLSDLVCMSIDCGDLMHLPGYLSAYLHVCEVRT